MDPEPLLTGSEIYNLIPQRPPIVMIDRLYSADEEGAVTGLKITEDNIFSDGEKLLEPGLIEHIAQSAAAFAGYPFFIKGEKPRLGYIGEIKKFRLIRFPLCGESLKTSLKVMGNAAGVTLISAETSVSGETVTTCNKKIFLKND